MIDLCNKKTGDKVWVINQNVCDLLHPTQEEIYSIFLHESDNSIRALIYTDDIDSYPLCRLFETKQDATIYGTVLLLKTVNMFEASESSFKKLINDTLIAQATQLMREYEVKYPDRVLFHQMSPCCKVSVNVSISPTEGIK